MGLEIGADIGVLIGDLTDKVNRMQGDLTQILSWPEKTYQAQFIPITQQVTLNTSGYGIIDLGQPPAGTYWIVRLIQFSDATNWLNSMGGATVLFCKGDIPILPGNDMPPGTVRWPFTVCPNTASFGTNHLTYHHGDRMSIQITGGNNGQQIQATVEVEQWQTHAKKGPERGQS